MLELIVNPIAGKGKSLKNLEHAEKVFKERGVEYRVHKTEKYGHATEIAKELTSKGEQVFLAVFGGDGTFNEVLNGIVDFEKTTVGFVPSGTGNDYVKVTDIPTEGDQALERILAGKTGYTDFIQMENKRCLNVAGGGMDTDTLVTYNSMKVFKGKMKYYASLLKVLAKCKCHKVRISIDGGTPAEKTVFMIAIANGKYIGGGMPISPHSDISDGKLNVVIVNEINRLQVLPMLLKFLNGGKHIESKFVEEYLCDSAKLEMLDECKVQADGEILEDRVLDCRVVHDTLKIFIA